MRPRPRGFEPQRDLRVVLEGGAVQAGGRGVEEWVTAELQITSNASVDAIELDKTWGEVGETLSGSVQLSSPAENRVLRVQVLDKHGRILWRKDEPTTVRPVVFSVPIRKEMPAHAYLRAVLMEGGREISSAMTRFTVPHRKHDAWNMVLWGRMYAGPENVIWAGSGSTRCASSLSTKLCFRQLSEPHILEVGNYCIRSAVPLPTISRAVV